MAATADTTPVKVGLVYSQSGALACYGKQYIEGFKAGLAYATNGHQQGRRPHPIEVTEVDDAGDPAKAVSAAKDLIGKGVKILAGSTASGVGAAGRPDRRAEQGAVHLRPGRDRRRSPGSTATPSAPGRQSYQDVLTAKSFIGDAAGKKVVVFAQDSAFGKANEAAVKAVIGGAGATVTSVLVPASATEFTPFASQVTRRQAGPALRRLGRHHRPGHVADARPAGRARLDHGGHRAGHPRLVADLRRGRHEDLLPVALLRRRHRQRGGQGAEGRRCPAAPLDLFHPDGFTAAQMVVHALEASGDDVDKMITALEGWSFDGVKGKTTVRAEDHALLQPMFQAKLTGSGTDMKAELRQGAHRRRSRPRRRSPMKG